MTRAVALFSGGLDSILSIKLVEEQGIEIVPVWIETGFHHMSVRSVLNRKGHCWIKEQFRKEYGLDVQILTIENEFTDLLISPHHGFGRNMNPCVDCKTAMMKRAKGYMYETGADFLVSGEVLGQRPMSQHMNALVMIEKEAGVNGLLLRPLSAKLLEPTIPEKQGLVDREQLLDLSGRTRKPQIALAGKMGIATFQQPAGGCILTDPSAGKKLRDFIDHGGTPGRDTAGILLSGRYFRISRGTGLICGRNYHENCFLESLGDSYILIMPAGDIPGPTGLVLGGFETETDEMTCLGILAGYTKKKKSGTRFRITYPDGKEQTRTASALDRETVERLRI